MGCGCAMGSPIIVLCHPLPSSATASSMQCDVWQAVTFAPLVEGTVATSSSRLIFFIPHGRDPGTVIAKGTQRVAQSS
ncbi:hypothetical protein L210DRAFT_2491924 [Boletus edulis BED1]|uniref:Uncharacterized protein n=1 Tax=Boletus edulis BED1 TaxID=1328754 RepID=A0AAD4BNZ7_BOLED|nr:hypothetical protein L210DRAFT_2491924 [Boletus edulis BED1]